MYWFLNSSPADIGDAEILKLYLSTSHKRCTSDKEQELVDSFKRVEQTLPSSIIQMAKESGINNYLFEKVLFFDALYKMLHGSN